MWDDAQPQALVYLFPTLWSPTERVLLFWHTTWHKLQKSVLFHKVITEMPDSFLKSLQYLAYNFHPALWRGFCSVQSTADWEPGINNIDFASNSHRLCTDPAGTQD